MNSESSVQKDRSSTTKPAKSFKKKLLFSVITLTLTLLVIELGVRVIFAVRVGPSVLLYGFNAPEQEVDRRTVGQPDSLGEQYTKYRPNQIRMDKDHETGALFRVKINGQGFRGEDFDTAKAPGVVRIVTLGASSTFGYYSRDDQTYPQRLEEILNEQGGTEFEVINLGVPHLTSSQIVALFHNEVLPLDADIVTFYQGLNDNLPTQKPPGGVDDIRRRLAVFPALRNAFQTIRSKLLTVNFLDSLAETKKPTAVSAEQLQERIDDRRQPYVDNLQRIRDACDERGILFIVATQQAQSMMFEREALKGMTYKQEVEHVRKKLDENGQVSRREAGLLLHDQLMDALRQWVEQTGTPLVDIISALDQDRDVLLSWVHLSPRGNDMIAQRFAEEIRRHHP